MSKKIPAQETRVPYGLLKGAGLLSVVVVVGGTLALSTPAAASPTRIPYPHTIDTSRVVGSPQGMRVAASVPHYSFRAPAVQTQPSSESVAAGATASFTASASGSPSPTVQWQVSTNAGGSFANVSGANAATYTFSATSSENGYEYRAVFSNFMGSATTNAATLTVTGTVSTSAPSITSSPTSESVASGSPASFSASASGSPTPTVQWQVSTNGGSSFTNVGGAVSTTYSFSATSSENGYQYQAVFTNSVGHATTAAATLTVTTTVSTSAPSITSSPTSESVASGSPASFSASASGSPTPTVQWQVSTNGGSSFTNVGGAVSTTYSFSATSSENGYRYRAVFTNSVGHATTAAATLTVTSAPSITSSPTSESVAAGSTASFSASASGSPTPTLQWQVSTNGGSSFTNVGGAVSKTYSFSATSSENGNQYQAVFTNSVGHATTAAATLTVTTNSSPPPTEQSSNWSGYADTGATFSAVTGTWRVPTVTCTNNENAYSAQWIGIDGDSSNTVEQDGTEADCLGGSPSYDAWYEMYGDNAVNSGYEVELSPSQYPVSPGDTMSASVSVVGSTWTLSISDGWTYSISISYSGAAKSSAEWIVERPEICSNTCSLASLPNFGSVTFSNASATSGSTTGGIPTWSAAAIEMVNGSTVLALPGAYQAATEGFTDTWEAI